MNWCDAISEGSDAAGGVAVVERWRAAARGAAAAQLAGRRVRRRLRGRAFRLRGRAAARAHARAARALPRPRGAVQAGASARAPVQHRDGRASRAVFANRTSVRGGHAARVVRGVGAEAAAPAGAHRGPAGGDGARGAVRAAHGERRLRVQPRAHAPLGREGAAPSAEAARHHSGAQVPRGARPLTPALLLHCGAPHVEVFVVFHAK